MEILENYVDNNEKVEIKNNIFEIISKDFSSVAWVTIVLVLIIWSYIQTETVMPKNAKLDIYKLSITEQIEDDIELN